MNSKFDADTQLALAISTSLVEERATTIHHSTDSAADMATKHHPQEITAGPVKDAFSILMTPSQSKKPGQKGRKKR